tara:strand:- start:326 stop:550 length:225 start_codon:yes stop_codon:yes gene_type:complete
MKNKIIEIIQSIRPELEFLANEDVILFGVLDSLDIILLVDEIESQLNVTISSEQIVPENFYSLNSLEAFIRTLS